MFKNRSTTDVVVVLFTMTVGAVMVLVVIGSVVAKLIHPEIDLKSAGAVISSTLTTIVGALVGFIGGRAAGRAEGNGSKYETIEGH